MSEILVSLIGGFIGGVIRSVIGILKSYRAGRKFRPKRALASLISSGLIGMIAGLFVEYDLRFSILAGYVGGDFIEGLYKVRFHERYR